MPRLANTAGCYIEENGERCSRKVYGYLMCNRHYTRWKRWGDPLGSAPKPTLADRFWAKVNKRGPDECWPWTNATITPAGYGQIGGDGKLLFAHRVSYELNVGSIPDGYEVDHLCHTQDESCHLSTDCPHRRCVNPAHLEAVPPLVNNMRSRSPQAENARKTKCRNGHPLIGDNLYVAPNGSRNCRICLRATKVRQYKRRALGLPPSRIPKLSDGDVATIRLRWADGGVTQKALAAEYNVTFTYIGAIVRGKVRVAAA